MELITIKTFDNSIDAHILIAKFDSEGIQSYLFDENIVSIYPLYNFTVGGIKLKISENDFEKAKKILSELEDVPYTNDQNETIVCPSCRSSDLHSGFMSSKGIVGFFFTIISFVFIVFPFYKKKVYRCKKCDTEFNNRSQLNN